MLRVVVYTFHPDSGGRGQGITWVWSTYQVLGHPELHGEILSQKIKLISKRKYKEWKEWNKQKKKSQGLQELKAHEGGMGKENDESSLGHTQF